MKFKDYYEILGVPRTAKPDEIKAAYRKLARQYHPDVNKEAGAEARFKEIGEAHEVLKDPEKRALYDRMGSQWKAGQDFRPQPGWDAGFEFRGAPGDFGGDFDPSDFFEALFGGRAGSGARAGGGAGRRRARNTHGEDHHAKVLIDIEDAYRGAQRTFTLTSSDPRAPERKLDVTIPKGIREGQQLRLKGQGGAGVGQGVSGDLYLEVQFAPSARFRVEGGDVYASLKLSPWEAALGAKVEAAVPDGVVDLTIPAGSAGGRKMRLRGRGIPGDPPGDLYVELSIALPKAETDAEKEAYRAFAKAFRFDPRH